MRNNTDGPRRRPKRLLNTYRILATFLLVVIAAMVAIALVRLSDMSDRSFAPIDTVQATKVERAATFLQIVGFNDPIYLGITPAVEGDYPTFRATAIGGESVDLWIRTTSNGGLEIQPVGIFETVASADDFARLASDAVYAWENISPDIQPSTDGSYGEYESLQYQYELLSPYDPDDAYWDASRDETSDWPRK
jgi:hypothetical protein